MFSFLYYISKWSKSNSTNFHQIFNLIERVGLCWLICWNASWLAQASSPTHQLQSINQNNFDFLNWFVDVVAAALGGLLSSLFLLQSTLINSTNPQIKLNFFNLNWWGLIDGWWRKREKEKAAARFVEFKEFKRRSPRPFNKIDSINFN